MLSSAAEPLFSHLQRPLAQWLGTGSGVGALAAVREVKVGNPESRPETLTCPDTPFGFLIVAFESFAYFSGSWHPTLSPTLGEGRKCSY